MIAVEEALQRIFAHLAPLVGETVPLAEAGGRVLAAALTAGHSQPPFDASAMDGYAVRAADVVPGRPLRMIGTAQAGQRFSGMMGAGQCVRIFTGAPLPIGADTVIMQEDAVAAGAEIRFDEVPPVGRSVRRRGSVFAEGQALLPAGTALTPARVALAASANRPNVVVARRPRVALLATGDELVAPGRPLGPDQIAASNSFGLRPLLAPFAAEIIDLGIVRDDLPSLTRAIEAAFAGGVDVLVTTGGASVGERDYVQEALGRLGVELDFWKLAMRPGKPLMFGTKGSTLVFGLPGNPISALVTATVVVIPAIRKFAGDAEPEGRRLRLALAAALPPNGVRRHYLRGRLEPAPGGTQIMPLEETDSGHLASFAASDALIIQPEDDPGQPAGAAVDVILL